MECKKWYSLVLALTALNGTQQSLQHGDGLVNQFILLLKRPIKIAEILTFSKI